MDVRSRDGSVFEADLRVEFPPVDGAPKTVAVLTKYGRGWRSAHREAAARAFGTTYGRVRRVVKLEHVNVHGVLVVHSWWFGPSPASSLNLD